MDPSDPLSRSILLTAWLLAGWLKGQRQAAEDEGYGGDEDASVGEGGCKNGEFEKRKGAGRLGAQRGGLPGRQTRHTKCTIALSLNSRTLARTHARFPHSQTRTHTDTIAHRQPHVRHTYIWEYRATSNSTEKTIFLLFLPAACRETRDVEKWSPTQRNVYIYLIK